MVNDWFCVKCKQVTTSKGVKSQMTKNNKIILVGTCSICGKKKSTFIPKKKGGSTSLRSGGSKRSSANGFVNSMLNSGKLPEMHLPGYSYCGPGTKLRERLLRGDAPINKLDKHCKTHDMTYSIFKEKKDRHVFDKQLQDEAFKIANDPKSTVREKIDAGLVGSVMLGKRKLGLGHK